MQHSRPNDPAAGGNDPADNFNVLVGVGNAVLIEAGIVALIVLLFRLF